MTAAVETLYSRNTKYFYKGTSFRERGNWEAYTHYFCDEYNIDYITFNGCLLECIKTHYSNSSNYPVIVYDESLNPIGLADSTYWKLVISSLKGPVGPIGPVGPMGPIGPQGPRGYNGSVDNFIVLSEQQWEELVGWDPNKFYFVYEDEIEPESFYAYVEGTTLCTKGDINNKVITLDEHYCSYANNTLTIVAGVIPPVFSQPSGSYPNPITVAITTNTIGATIYYTYDGTEPTINSYEYTSPLTVETSKTIKAKAFKSGMLESTTSAASYIIGGSGSEVTVDGQVLTDPTGTCTNNIWNISCTASVTNKILTF